MNTIEYGQGAVNNTIGWGQGAKVGSSFSNLKSIALDGVDDFVTMGNPLSLQFTNTVSMSAWFKTTDTTSTQVIIGKEAITSGNRSYMLYYSGTGGSFTIKFLIFTSGSANNQAVSTSTVTDGNWHHVLGVNDGSNLKIYIDGVLEDTNVGGGGAIQSSTADFFIGRRGNSSSSNREYWNGSIDEVAVWNSDQSANASAIYGSGVPTSLSTYSPLSWWRCGDGDTSPTLTDNGSESNDGTMTNFSTFSTNVPVELFSRKSIALDGVDDFVTMGNPSNLNFERTDSFSMSLWFNKPTSSGAEFLLGKNEQASPRSGYFAFTSGNLVHFRITTSGGFLLQIRDNDVHNLNVWEHYVFTYDGSSTSSGINIYKNGTLLTNVARSGATLTQSIQTTVPFTLGARQGLGLFAESLIDEVGVFNSELSASDVTSIYGSGVPNDISSLSPVSWWRCGDGDTAPTLTDNGSGGNNGTMTNFSTFSTDVPT